MFRLVPVEDGGINQDFASSAGAASKKEMERCTADLNQARGDTAILHGQTRIVLCACRFGENIAPALTLLDRVFFDEITADEPISHTRTRSEVDSGRALAMTCRAWLRANT